MERKRVKGAQEWKIEKGFDSGAGSKKKCRRDEVELHSNRNWIPRNFNGGN